ncbi:unnamed protein product [Peronospora belbahrii]|uniref:FYVE-type domain-containing protein n=1 Tax=Peronospora belbahrii TaxID=622444 RepID=A0AAU9L7T3_9STRA|nr:unnamed protein product [Peronospora belbahrii]
MLTTFHLLKCSTLPTNPVTMTTVCPFEIPLTLSERDRQSMHNLAERFVNETMLDYEQVLASKSGLPSAARWKPLRHKDNVVIYQDQLVIEEIKRENRKTKSLGDVIDFSRVGDLLSRSMGPGTFPSSSASPFNRDTALIEPKKAPKMIWMGTVECELDDLMYGLGSQSEEVTRINYSYAGKNIQDFTTLASLEKSTPNDVFHSLQLKWEVNRALTRAKPVWRCRDFVYLEATGVTLCRSTGQRIGYQILHSLDVRGVPELPGRKLTRGKITIYQLFRQKSKGTVEVFAKAMVDLAGDIPVNMASFATIEAANSVNIAARCARKRKLNWLLVTAADHYPNGASANQSNSCCSVCARKLRNAFGQKAFFECHICTQRVCHRCHVRQELSFIKPNKSLVIVEQKSLDLCTPCVHRATQTNARRVALEESALKDPASMYKYIPRKKNFTLDRGTCCDEVETAIATTGNTNSLTHTAVLFDRVTEVFHRLF